MMKKNVNIISGCFRATGGKQNSTAMQQTESQRKKHKFITHNENS